MKRRLKDALKRFGFRLHRLGSRFGLLILPSHYYLGVPNVLELERTRGEWQRKSALPGLDIDLDAQARTVDGMCAPYRAEYAGNAAYREGVAKAYGPGYGYIEAQALHAVTRHLRPRRIIEVGSGVSTHCMQAALALNRRDGTGECEMTCVEPFPSAWLRQVPGIRLIEDKVQTVPVDEFRRLESGDMLFIDSSHTVKPGSDVNYLVLEVLPALRAGVVVHVHDIFLPYDYQRNVLKTYLHWSETSLLRAYLAGNDRVEILFCLSHLHYERPEELKSVFPEYDPAPDDEGLNPAGVRPFEQPPGHFPSSIYLRTR